MHSGNRHSAFLPLPQGCLWSMLAKLAGSTNRRARAHLSDSEVEFIQASAPVCHCNARHRFHTVVPLLKSRTDHIPASLQGANSWL